MLDILVVSSDPAFNYFFSIGVYWGFLMGGFFGVLALFAI